LQVNENVFFIQSRKIFPLSSKERGKGGEFIIEAKMIAPDSVNYVPEHL
jgi:hypothetical protein